MTYTGRLGYTRAAQDDVLTGSDEVEKTSQYAVIKRHVQTCAYVEDRGEETRYGKRWVSDMEVPDSSRFEQSGYDNTHGNIQSGSSYAKGLSVTGNETIGQMKLSTSIDSLRILGGDDIVPVRTQVQGARQVDEIWAYIDPECDLDNGTIGGQRVRFSVMRDGDLVTGFGIKKGQAIEPYHGSVYLSEGGRDKLILQVKSHGNENQWMFWCGGGVAIWIGLYLILSPILLMVTWIPLVGGLFKGAATMVTFFVALALTAGFVFWGWGMETWMDWFSEFVR